MELTDEARADVAQQMGMKPREIVAVDKDEVIGGLVVTTHDGVKSLLTEDGVKPYAPAPVEVAKEQLAEVVQRPPATPETPVTGAPAVVPEGSEKDVLDWVGDDKDRAAVALKVEQNHAKPRKGLVDKLQKLAG